MNWQAWRFLGLMIVLAALGAIYLYSPFRQQDLADAEAALQQRDLEAALVFLSRAEEKSPDNPEVQFLLARTARRGGDIDQMQTHLKKAAKLGYPAERLDREQKLALAQIGRLSEVEQQLPDLLVNAGEDGREICEAFVNGYLIAYRFQDALGLLEPWQAEYPEDPQPHFVRGLIQLNMRNEGEAIDAFEHALKLDANHKEARLNLALLLVTRHQYQQAMQHFRLLLERHPDDPDARCGLAECLIGEGHIDEGRSVLTELLESDPEFDKARLTLGRLELDAGQAKDAVQILEPLVKSEPKNSEARFIYGSALQMDGQNVEAKHHLEYAAEARPALQRVRRLMEDLLTKPDDADLRFDIGSTLMKYDSPVDAAEWLRSVVDIQPNHAEAHRMLAEYYQSVGKNQLATHHQELADRHMPIETPD